MASGSSLVLGSLGYVTQVYNGFTVFLFQAGFLRQTCGDSNLGLVGVPVNS